MTSTLSTVRQAILLVIDENGEIAGTETLACTLNLNNNKGYVIRSARLLQRAGVLTIIPSNGGRGKKTIYKRNRNQPGVPRKR